MKAKSTIQKQIRRLRKLAESNNTEYELRRGCYDAYYALRWVIEDTDWSPANIAEQEDARIRCKP